MTLIELLRDAAATGRSLIDHDTLMLRAADALAADMNILAARDAEVAQLTAEVAELQAALGHAKGYGDDGVRGFPITQPKEPT